MRRVVTVFATLAAAGAMALSVPGSAMAAQGTLHLGGEQYDNPSGCYDSAMWPLSVGNRTDQPAYVYDGAGCHGNLIGVVRPGRNGLFEFGASVRIR